MNCLGKLSIILASILCIYFSGILHKENFTADGWVYNVPPEWYRSKKYTMSDWFTVYYPDQVSQATGCDSEYRGDYKDLNYLSSAYRFWRM